MAAGNVNPFNVSDSEEEAEQRQDGADTERSPSDEAQGHSLGPFSPPAYSEPAVLLSSNRTSPSVDGIPASAAAVAGIGGGGAETRVSLDAIAAQLLRDQYILTALELHTELLEAGRELPRLRDYFSNPGNFERQSGTPPACKEQGVGPGGPLHRANSISTLDSLDFARYSDDGNRESDERVAVLEFELRKAKETIQALRANLTQAAECEIPSQERKNYKSSPEIQEPIRSLEKRALNFLVNEYLLKNEYKLTAITFSDENDDQDFELWDDVGLNIPKPQDLLQLYRNCGNSLPLHRETVDVGVNVDANDLPGGYFSQEPVQKTEAIQQEVVQELEYQISLLNSEKQSLAEQIKKLQSDIQALQRNVSSEPTSAVKLTQSKENTPCGKPPLDNGQYLDIRGVTETDGSSDANTTKTSTTTNATTDCTESTTTAAQPHSKLKSQSQQGKTSVQFDQPNRKLSPAFHQALLSFCRMSADSRLGSEVSRIADSEQSVMLMLGRCLPHIVPNVLLAKREVTNDLLTQQPHLISHHVHCGWANPAYHELLLTVLWYGVVHTSALVRCTAARMFELLVKGVNETLVAQRVVPALITLSSDPEISVRISTIPAFGTIMETVTQKELLERVKMQLASFLEDPQYQDQHSLHMEIIKTFGRVGPNAEPRFRDEFVLPHLHKLALCNNQQTVESKRIDIATQLFEAYSALSCCFISEELMVNHFLPGLRCLRTDMEQLSPEHEVILSSMIKECEIKVENKGIGEAQGSISIAASLVGEDAKTKFLSKMGQLTTSGAMLANVFQRKK
ncbi:RAB11-binding protein RELCH homolog [Garra rufa]|uniref:RAB11-binding protein RELCH homolog n=1 Tax=Garra rufa TaxID=137080 RepID=UPI003CCE8413